MISVIYFNAMSRCIHQHSGVNFSWKYYHFFFIFKNDYMKLILMQRVQLLLFFFYNVSAFCYHGHNYHRPKPFMHTLYKDQTCIITAWSCLWIAGFQGKGCLDYGNLSQNIFICIHFTYLSISSFLWFASRRSGQVRAVSLEDCGRGGFFVCCPEAVNTSRASVVCLLWLRPQQLKPRDTERGSDNPTSLEHLSLWLRFWFPDPALEEQR